MQTEMTERGRIATLSGYGILDTPNEPAFDLLVREVADMMRVPSALISFIDSTRQWYKARVGVDVTEVPRLISFCTHSIERDEVTVVLDATRDERFRANPAVTKAGGIRFYAAAPIKALNRARIGTVCVYDVHPRIHVPARAVHQLASCAARVVELLEERKWAQRAGQRRAG